MTVMAKHPAQSKPKTAGKSSHKVGGITRKGTPTGPKRRHGGS